MGRIRLVRVRAVRLLLAATLSAASAAHAQSRPEVIEKIEVTGNYENGVGTSDAASQGTVTAKLIQGRPILRPAEILEFVPGLVVTQHSGDGKANQYFLRGFNLDHGTDFATFFGGTPVSMRTHVHGQGYTDLNFLIPELVRRIDYFKGPYFASAGLRALVADNSKRSKPTTLLYGRIGYRIDARWRLDLDMFNLLDRKASDVD